jgi:phosphopantothenoylcysteine synthetase/decarboxylase
MRCLVTAGPTCEPLDAVRRLTNFSTGRLGTELALALARAGHTVVLLRSETATWPAPSGPGLEVRPFTTTASLGDALAALAGPAMDAVFHAAAVSDFAFGSVWRREPDGRLVEVRAGKLPTRAAPLLAELVPTPKWIARLRDWFPRARLVGWKYEVDGDRAAALAAGAAQLRDCATDACVVNGPAYGPGFGLVTPAAAPRHCGTRDELFAALLALAAGNASPLPGRPGGAG